MIQTHKQKAKINPWGDDNPEKHNQQSSYDNSLAQQVKNLVNPGSMIDQLFGKKTSSEYLPHQEMQSPPRSKSETLIFSHSERHADQMIKHETSQLLKQLKEQVSLLEHSEKALSGEIAKIKVAQIPSEGGIYYLRFFEWLIGLVKQLRMKVDEGRIWLQTFNQKKKKKLGYWKMYKKHGTTFGMSHERGLSTQTG